MTLLAQLNITNDWAEVFYLDFYLFKAAKNKGWSVEIIRDNSPYLIKYVKNDLFFYSTKFVSIDVNHQSPVLADNKIMTYEVLNREGIDIIPLEEISDSDKEKNTLLYNKYSFNGIKQIVIKPINSFGAEGAKRCSSLNSFLTSVDERKGDNLSISAFFEHVAELRFIVFQGKIEIIHPKYDNPKYLIEPNFDSTFQIGLKRFKRMKTIALNVADILKYDFLVVDFLVSKDGFKVIEVNLNPNLLTYSDLSKRNESKVVKLYEKLFDYKENLLGI